MAKKNLKSLIAKINQNVQAAELPEPEPKAPDTAPAQPAPKQQAVAPTPTKAPPVPAAQPVEDSELSEASAEPTPKRSNRTTKPTSFWLYDSDRARLTELGMLLYAQGIAPNNALLFRAALKLAPTDYRLVDTVRELMAQDGRVKANKAKE